MKLKIIDVLLISFLLSAVYIYWLAITVDGSQFSSNISGQETISNARPPVNASVYTGYILTAEDDRISFDIVYLGVKKWYLEINIVDLATGERFSFSSTYSSPRSQTPLFITPHAGYYYYNITAKVLDADFPTDLRLIIKLSGSQAIKLEIIDRLPYFVSMVFIAYVVVKYISKRSDAVFWRGFLGELNWEFKTTNAWLFFLAIFYLYLLIIFDLRSFTVGDYKYYLLHIMSLSKVLDFFLIYFVIISMLVVLLFSYKWETGLERTDDILPRGRLKRFLTKYLTVVLTGYVPIVVLSFINYMLWIPELMTRRPIFFIDIYIRGLLYYFLILLLCISLCIIQAVAISKTSISLLSSILPGLLLYLESPLVPPDLYLRPLLFNLDPKHEYLSGMEGLFWVDGWRYFTMPEDNILNWILLHNAKVGMLSFPIFIIILSLSSTIIALMIYLIKENP